MNSKLGFAGVLAETFVNSKLTPLIVVVSILLGLGAVFLIPREEEPQIKVPMIDIIVSFPGSSPKEIQERATIPMEKLLWEIPGVEYIYSISQPDVSLVMVRFKVGEKPEESVVKITQKLQANYDRIPPGVSFPLIKMRSIDYVPILTLTFHSSKYDHFLLRRLAAEVEDEIKSIPLVSETKIIGGLRRQIRVQVDPTKLSLRGLTLADLIPSIRQSNQRLLTGKLTAENYEFNVEANAFLTTVQDVENIVIAVKDGKPTYLKDVAQIVDGPEEPNQYVLHWERSQKTEEPAVTLTVAKKVGANAITVIKEVQKKIDLLKGTIVPKDVSIKITRNYGETAQEKSNELIFHMFLAVLSVCALIWFSLGARESLVVALAIPSTLALTLLVFYLLGFTLNRVTLFALIFSIGILVDDAIVVVENIARHLSLKENANKDLFSLAVDAVAEVGNPTILATFAVIFAVLPMAFVGGLMGPYMRPIPIGASVAMLFSLLIAFVVTPWATVRILANRQVHHPSNSELERSWSTRLYRRVMEAILQNRKHQKAFLLGTAFLLLAAISSIFFKFVKLKMLPFDNKSEFQIILNMPEGSTLEETAQAAREISFELQQDPNVEMYQIYVGTAAPFNFNGLIRRYFLRSGSTVADIQVSLESKKERTLSSHEIAKNIRQKIAPLVKKYGARVTVAEIPPGPPVLQTLVTEVYGPDEKARYELAKAVKDIYSSTEGIVDVDWYAEEDQVQLTFYVDQEKAKLSGVSADELVNTLTVALKGMPVDILHDPAEKEDVFIVVEVPRQLKSSIHDLLQLRVRGSSYGGEVKMVPLKELVQGSETVIEKRLYRKNLMPVVYVVGDVVGRFEGPAYGILALKDKISQLDARSFGGRDKQLKVYHLSMPFSDQEPAIKWDGEWHITLEVFRDLGIAFGVVLILIYFLMVGWFQNFITPLIVMSAIPFSLIGILPTHGILGAFFTATSMIGFMAGAGIVVRNSIILVDFIEMKLSEGMPLKQAVIDAGAIRFRPMLLTAMAVVVGAAVILFDPIFQGLAISLMAGEVASLLISRLAVPLFYYLYKSKSNNLIRAQH